MNKIVNSTPIYDVVTRYGELSPMRYHTAGHSGGNNTFPPIFDYMKYDITELSFSDNLENPTSVIKTAEEKSAYIYNSKRSLFFTSGATTAILSAVYAVKSFTNNVLVTSNCHKCVFNALKIFDFNITVADCNDIDFIKSCLTNKTVGAFIFTSPDYFGNVYVSARELCSVCMKNGIITICDEAHGSHFVFSDSLPDSATSYADLVIDSVHKTLPVQAGGAILNITDDKLISVCENARKTINTTSPSYITLASIDYFLTYFYKNGKRLYNQLKKTADVVIKKLSTVGYVVDKSDDFSRLIININTSNEVLNQLEKENVFVEGAVNNKLILIVTPFNAKHLKKLANILSKKFFVDNIVKPCKNDNCFVHRQISSTVSPVEYVSLENSLGKISANEVGVYPPATPILFSGDVITQNVIDYLNDNKNKLYGLFDDKIAVVISCKKNK